MNIYLHILYTVTYIFPSRSQGSKNLGLFLDHPTFSLAKQRHSLSLLYKAA